MTEKTMPSPGDSDPQVQHVLLLVHQLAQCADDLFRSNAKLRDLTPRQYVILQTIEQFQGISQMGLVDRTGIDRSTITDIVKRLQTKKLLVRTRTKWDARKYAIQLTERGRQLMIDAKPSAEKVVEEFLAPLPESQRAEFIANLARIPATLQSSRKLE